jgi:hypothetical protein
MTRHSAAHIHLRNGNELKLAARRPHLRQLAMDDQLGGVASECSQYGVFCCSVGIAAIIALGHDMAQASGSREDR